MSRVSAFLRYLERSRNEKEWTTVLFRQGLFDGHDLQLGEVVIKEFECPLNHTEAYFLAILARIRFLLCYYYAGKEISPGYALRELNRASDGLTWQGRDSEPEAVK